MLPTDTNTRRLIQLIGTRLRERREELQLSREALAAPLQISTEILTRIEDGTTDASLSTMLALSLRLAGDTDWSFAFVEAEDPFDVYDRKHGRK